MEIEKYEWSCIRTNNGEWISEIHTQILDDDELYVLENLASQEGRELDKHYGHYDIGEKYIWCYENDINELINRQ